jgi:N4-gp56 family major capsid protein
MPVPVKGKKYYVLIISPDQEADIKMLDSAWNQAQREAQKPGMDNPLFTGANGIYNQTIIHTHENIPLATTWGSSTNLAGATGFFLGTGAAGIAYALRNIWNEKTFDYGNKVGFCIGKIYGTSKAVFNSADNAIVGLRTYRSNN